MRLLVALVIWAGAVFGAIAVSSTVAHSIHKTTAGGSGGGGGVDASTVKAADSSSMFRTANLAHAIKAIRGHLGDTAPLTGAALYPGYLSITAIKHGAEADVYVNVNGDYNETDTGGNPGSDRPFSLAKISAGTPAAIAHKIATEAHLPTSQLHYMVIERDPISHKLEWLIYTLPGHHVEYFQTSGANGPLYVYRTNSATGLQRVSRLGTSPSASSTA
jgi:hypothetical protein